MNSTDYEARRRHNHCQFVFASALSCEPVSFLILTCAEFSPESLRANVENGRQIRPTQVTLQSTPRLSFRPKRLIWLLVHVLVAIDLVASANEPIFTWKDWLLHTDVLVSGLCARRFCLHQWADRIVDRRDPVELRSPSHRQLGAWNAVR